MNNLFDEDAIQEDEQEEGKIINGIKNVDKPRPTIDSILGLWKRKILKTPDFQRKFVWTIKQSSRFIESLLLGVPIPSLMFYQDAESNQLVVDGQQRIKSIIYFVGDDSIDINKLPKEEHNRYKFKLTGLSDGSQYEGRTFEQLSETDQRKLLYICTLDINLITLSDPNDLSSIYYIFERLNTGGTPLKPQEIRNCICAGKFNDFLFYLNDNKTWRKFFNDSNAIDHLQDVELILRFFALHDRLELYTSPMKDYLTDYMKEKKNLSDKEIKEKEKIFISTIESVYLHLGNRAFRPNNGINSSIFDSVMLAFAKNINNIPNDIKDKYERLCTNKEYLKYCGKSSGDVSSVRYRRQMANDYLFGKVSDINLKVIKLYEIPVSAGYGNTLNDENLPYKEITTTNRRVDFALLVSGDSMEPEIPNGSIILIKKQDKIYSGQIGVFLYDGEIRCKKYKKNKNKISLISLNKEYQPLVISSNRQFKVMGEVVEILSDSQI